MVILTFKADISGHVTNRSKTGKNTTESSNGSRLTFEQEPKWDRDGNAQFSPWDM